MKQRFICKVKHPRNFGIALQIMAELKRSCGTVSIADIRNYTLLGSGYIEKANRLPNGNCYSLTSKGEDELRYHTSVERHKMFIQSMT
jgi:hypothetical protein